MTHVLTEAAALAHEFIRRSKQAERSSERAKQYREWARVVRSLINLKADALDSDARTIAELKEALQDIERNNCVPLDKVDGESLDATGAKRLYDAWVYGIRRARAVLEKTAPDQSKAP